MALNPRSTSLLQRKRTATPQGQTGQTAQSNAFGSAVKAQSSKESIRLIEEGVQGFSDAAGLRPRAEILEFNARQETLKGQQEALIALESLNDVQAANIVAAFASGIRLQGSVTRAQEAVGRKAAFSISISKTNAAIRAGALKREARRLRAEAKYNQQIAPLKIVAGAVIAYYSGGQA